MTGEQIWGVVRTVLAAGGGYIVAKGYIDNATMTSLIGAVGTIFIAGWSIWAKK
jgi:energy-converting hydrogenase Eha subunit C